VFQYNRNVKFDNVKFSVVVLSSQPENLGFIVFSDCILRCIYANFDVAALTIS